MHAFSDMLMHGLVQAMCAVAYIRYGQAYNWMVTCYVITLCTGILGALAWSRVAPGQYVAWREAVVAIVRILANACPVVPLILTTMLRSANPWQQGAMLGHVLFMGLLLFSSGVLGMMWYALALRLPLPLHAIVQGMSTFLFLKHVPSLCACGAMEQAQSVSVMRRLYAVFDLVSMRWLFGAPSGPASPAGECWAVMAALQICMGYVFPTVVLAVRECRKFVEFWRQARGHYRSSWRTWLYENTTDGPLNAGWVRWGKLALASVYFFSVLWDILVVLSVPRHDS
jgi:hypothetical protein